MVIDDVVTPELTAEIMTEYGKGQTWFSYDGNDNSTGSKAIDISDPRVIGTSEVRKTLDQKVHKAFAAGVEHYHAKFSRREQGLDFLGITRSTGFRLLKYPTGSSLRNHTDKHPELIPGRDGWPLISCSVMLNDDYEGGKLIMLDGDYVVPVKAGRGVFYPSTFLYPHYVDTVTQGTRYVLVTWFL